MKSAKTLNLVSIFSLTLAGCRPQQAEVSSVTHSSRVIVPADEPIELALSVGMKDYVSKDVKLATAGLSNAIFALHKVQDSERWVAPGIRYTMLGITHGRLALCYEQLNKIELYHTNISLATKFLSIGAKMNKATNSIISESQVRKWVDKMDKSLDPEWRRTKQ